MLIERMRRLVSIFLDISQCTCGLFKSTPQDFYCIDPNGGRFRASGDTVFESLIDAVYTSLACMDTNPKPPLAYKLSTDPKNTAWEPLNSPDDWADIIDEVCNRKGLKRGKARRSIDVLIGVYTV